MGLLRTLLILALIYFAFRVIFKVVLPLLLKKAVNKATQNAQEQFRRQQEEREFFQSRQNPDIKIKPPGKNRGKQDDEYTDWEEVK